MKINSNFPIMIHDLLVHALKHIQYTKSAF